MKYRNVIAVGLAVLMFTLITICVYNWEELTTSRTKIIYGDGCIEIYKNENLTTPECTEGRLLEQMRKVNSGGPKWINIS